MNNNKKFANQSRRKFIANVGIGGITLSSLSGLSESRSSSIRPTTVEFAEVATVADVGPVQSSEDISRSFIDMCAPYSVEDNELILTDPDMDYNLATHEMNIYDKCSYESFQAISEYIPTENNNINRTVTRINNSLSPVQTAPVENIDIPNQFDVSRGEGGSVIVSHKDSRMQVQPNSRNAMSGNPKIMTAQTNYDNAKSPGVDLEITPTIKINNYGEIDCHYVG